jgi:hypothetical protein
MLWGLPVAAGALGIAWLHTHLYGSPLRSGYGSADELYALGNVVTNLRRYAGWLAATEAVWLLAAAPAAMVGRRPPRATQAAVASLWPLVLLTVLTVASYLPYAAFDDWWYTRFLLPAFPAALLLAAAGWTNLLRRASGHTAAVALALVTALVAWQARTTMEQRDVLTLRAIEARYVLAGTLLASDASQPVVLAAQHSGSLRVHAGVETLRWDLLSPPDLETALAFLRSRGRRPLILVDLPEEAAFRARFAALSPVGRLDWPPAAEAHTRIGVRLYDPAHRELYVAGGRIDTRHVFPPRR